jgi:peptidoglycan hydrolase-like protein with peptidoglycan-binding domain
MRRTLLICGLVPLLAALFAADAGAMGKPRVAALQIGLANKGLYAGTIDGVWGRATETAVRRLQRRARIGVDGIPGPRTRRALGKLGRHGYGTRALFGTKTGWDVSMTQFLLGWHGFPSGPMDGHFGPRTQAAVMGFQRFAHLGVDGVVGPATFRALRRPLVRPGIRLTRPVGAAPTDGFGPRGNRFHTGLDFPAGYGATIVSAAGGRVVQVGWDPAGYGNFVVVKHGPRAATWYAHLSVVRVSLGERVDRGERIGNVGSTGNASGPHLHFELRIRRACVDPRPRLI